MKKTLMMATLLSLGFIAKAQVGINNNLPQATLDVTGKPTDTTVMDGIIPPRLSGDELRAKTYTSSQTGAFVYVTAADSAPASQTTNVTAAGYYYFNGTQWVAIGSGSSSSTLYQNIRGGVTTVTSTTYTVQPSDYLIVTNAASGVTITFPNLTAADAGRTILLYNNNTTAAGNTLAPVTPFPASGLTSNNQGRGRTIAWTGTTWLVVGT